MEIYLKIPVHIFEIPIFSRGVFNGAIIMNTSINELKVPLKRFMKLFGFLQFLQL